MPENLVNHLPAPLSLDLIATLPCAPAAYVLFGRNGRRYTGAARDLRERMRDHHAGRAERTKNQRPLILLHLEPLPTSINERFFLMLLDTAVPTLAL
jgi:hypothetical protein